METIDRLRNWIRTFKPKYAVLRRDVYEDVKSSLEERQWVGPSLGHSLESTEINLDGCFLHVAQPQNCNAPEWRGCDSLNIAQVYAGSLT